MAMHFNSQEERMRFIKGKLEEIVPTKAKKKKAKKAKEPKE